MTKLAAIAVFLSLIPFASAQDQLGSISASSVSCPDTGLQATACYALDITCPDIPDYTAYVKILTPARPVGTVIFSTGGDDTDVYENYTYGLVTVQNVVAAGYEAVELTFGAPFSDGPGWQHDVAGMGIRAASCRYATVAKWVYDTTRAFPLCVTGQSGGSQEIGEGLAHYGLGSYLRFAELTSGPPFSQEDYACIDNIVPATEYCSGFVTGMGVGLQNAVSFVDPAYPGPWCSESMLDHSTEHEAQFLMDSVTSPDAVLSYPNTKIRFLFGGQDATSAIRQGLNYQSQIVQPTDYACVEAAPHTIPDDLDGARTIAADLIANCH